MFPPSTVGRISPVGVSGRSSRELVAALGATGLQDGTSCAGLHTMAEAVLLGTATIIWLESAFHARLLGLVPRALDNTGRTTYWAERWDYNARNSTGISRFFSPVENLLPSLPLPRVGGGVHTLWTVLWTAHDTGSG